MKTSRGPCAARRIVAVLAIASVAGYGVSPCVELLNEVLARASLKVALEGWKRDDAPGGRRWWSHVASLADDALEGRDTGNQGHRKAAAGRSSVWP